MTVGGLGYYNPDLNGFVEDNAPTDDEYAGWMDVVEKTSRGYQRDTIDMLLHTSGESEAYGVSWADIAANLPDTPALARTVYRYNTNDSEGRLYFYNGSSWEFVATSSITANEFVTISTVQTISGAKTFQGASGATGNFVTALNGIAVSMNHRSSRGSAASPTTASANDGVGEAFYTYLTGTGYLLNAYIFGANDNHVPTASDSRGSLLFYTTPTGSTTPALAMTISSAKTVTIPKDFIKTIPQGDSNTTKAHFGDGTYGHTFTNTTGGGVNPLYTMRADGGATKFNIISAEIDPADDTGVPEVLEIRIRQSDATAIVNRLLLAISNNGTNAILINAAGQIGLGMVPTTQLELSTNSAQKPTSSLWTITSAIEIKNVIGDYKKGLAELMRVKVKRWSYNGNYGYNACTQEHIGIVIDENDPDDISKIFPDSVKKNDRHYNHVYEDIIQGRVIEDGKIIKEGWIKKVVKSYDTIELNTFDGNDLLYTAITSIQELKIEKDQEIENLTTIVEELRFELDEIKKALK